VSRFIRFLEATWQELGKVNWPTPQQARNLTIVVLVVSAAVGAYISLFDYIFALIAKSIDAG
jgi:preprotein translocase SecE subunit